MLVVNQNVFILVRMQFDFIYTTGRLKGFVIATFKSFYTSTCQ